MSKNLVGAFSNQNPFYYIENELLLTTPYTTNDMPIKINDYQNSFLKHLLNSKSDKTLFLSPRQKGLSTIMMSYSFWLCSQLPKTCVGIYTIGATRAKTLQTIVTPKEPSGVTLNSGRVIHFGNQSRINFISENNFCCGDSLDCLFVDNASNFDETAWISLQPCLSGNQGKFVVLVSGEEGKFSIPSGMPKTELTTVIQ